MEGLLWDYNIITSFLILFYPSKPSQSTIFYFLSNSWPLFTYKCVLCLYKIYNFSIYVCTYTQYTDIIYVYIYLYICICTNTIHSVCIMLHACVYFQSLLFGVRLTLGILSSGEDYFSHYQQSLLPIVLCLGLRSCEIFLSTLACTDIIFVQVMFRKTMRLDEWIFWHF